MDDLVSAQLGVGGECWSSANGVAGGGCSPGTQCGPWLPDGGTWDRSAPWYCVANPAIAAGASGADRSGQHRLAMAVRAQQWPLLPAVDPELL